MLRLARPRTAVLRNPRRQPTQNRWRQPTQNRWRHSTTKHNIVVLDQYFAPFPHLNFDYTIKYHPSTRPEDVPSLVKDSTIIVTSDSPITREAILAAKNLQLVATNGTGTDLVDSAAIRELGIALCNVPAQNTDSVAEHALALYFGLRRNLPGMHSLTMEGKAWGSDTMSRLRQIGEAPRTNAEETMVVFGYGALGKNLESLGKALGMQVLIAERKGDPETRPGRVPFLQCLRRGTVFILAAPLNETTRGMIGASELAAMDPTSLLVNVGRGGIIDELALVKALKEDRIGGAATDVFAEEPATKANSPLLDLSIPNLLLSPHMAWYSKRTIENTRLVQKANLEGFVSGRMINVVIPPGEGKRAKARGEEGHNSTAENEGGKLEKKEGKTG